MTEPITLRRFRLGPSHCPSGKTRHFEGSKLLPSPCELRIVKYTNDPGFYLFYCDNTGREFTDTYHESLKGAFDQAEWEFEVQENDWEVVTPT